MKGDYKTVVEIPYIFRARRYGESKLTMKTTMEYVKHIMILATETGRIGWILAVFPIFLLGLSM